MFSGLGEAPKIPGLERDNEDQVMNGAENDHGPSGNVVEAVSLEKKRTMVEEPKPHLDNAKE